MPRLLPVLIATLSALCLPAAAQVPASAWVQYVGDGAVEARAVVSGDRCPQVRLDGVAREMAERAGPTPAFPTRVCALRLPERVRRVEVGGVRLPAPRREIRRILVLGDTGCRLKGAQVQACNDPRLWPFATVARLASARRPDLVVHTGDYDYRESPCPAAETACAGSPSGDAQPSWDVDFLKPAEPLMLAAPWVMVRGNHESCSRTGQGWTRMLATVSPAEGCRRVEPAYVVRPGGGLKMAVIDSAEASDRLPTPQQTADMAGQLDALAPVLADRAGEGWLLTHRPVWALVPALKLGPLGVVDVAINATEQKAIRDRDLGGVDMAVSGHIHHFATYDFAGKRPGQLVVGTGGDIGEKADGPKARAGDVEIDGLPARRYTFYRFGYLLLDRSPGGGWSGGFHDIDDRLVATCRFNGRKLACRSVKRGG